MGAVFWFNPISDLSCWLCAQVPADVEPCGIRQPQIEHHQIRIYAEGVRSSVSSGGGDGHFKSLPREQVTEALSDTGIVFDHQYLIVRLQVESCSRSGLRMTFSREIHGYRIMFIWQSFWKP